MAWDISVMAFFGMSAFVLAFIGVEFIKVSIFKEQKKMVWALLGGFFIAIALGFIFGGFVFANVLLDSQDPTDEGTLLKVVNDVFEFYGLFIVGLMTLMSALIFWWLSFALIDFVKKINQKGKDDEKESEEY